MKLIFLKLSVHLFKSCIVLINTNVQFSLNPKSFLRLIFLALNTMKPEKQVSHAVARAMSDVLERQRFMLHTEHSGH